MEQTGQYDMGSLSEFGPAGFGFDVAGTPVSLGSTVEEII
jgi:hypothetical protein